MISKYTLVTLLIFMSVALSATQSVAEQLNGSDWQDLNVSEKTMYTMGAIEAFQLADFLSLADSQRESPFLFVTNCIPKSATYGQIVKVIDKYLENNPEYLHRNISVITIDSVNNAFHCSKEK